jgi:hypothetical protein
MPTINITMTKNNPVAQRSRLISRTCMILRIKEMLTKASCNSKMKDRRTIYSTITVDYESNMITPTISQMITIKMRIIMKTTIMMKSTFKTMVEMMEFSPIQITMTTGKIKADYCINIIDCYLRSLNINGRFLNWKASSLLSSLLFLFLSNRRFVCLLYTLFLVYLLLTLFY